MSATVLPRSRPATFAWTTIFRCTFSREIVLGPRSTVIAASCESGTFWPVGVSNITPEIAAAFGAQLVGNRTTRS